MDDINLALLIIGDYELQRRKLTAAVEQLQAELEKQSEKEEDE